MNPLIPPEALLLVGVVTNTRDLEIARLLGWYRIPFKYAPKVISVDYIAFYQTDAFGKDHRWRIDYVAEVRGYEMTTRAELFRDEPDHPRAHEEYYRIQLGPMLQLPRPILAGKWRRLTFLYTTGELLENAKILNDLVVKSDERALLWKALRERSKAGGLYMQEELPEIPLDPALLAMLGKWD
ncbi:MAG: hypothetical protein HGA53_03410 [Anaerolineaceae bacterium]|nr:hypothetical protein [Anaerolineaceae bacterium]